MDLFSLREEYSQIPAAITNKKTDPLQIFDEWLNEAIDAGIPEANAMSLATVNDIGIPSLRMVLLKHYDESGLTFFTNYESKKGIDIFNNSHVAVLFWWQHLKRQIRIEGEAAQINQRINNAYFAQRPKGSQIAASLSKQSQEIEQEIDLNEEYEKAIAKYNGHSVTRPENWGGYRILPETFEFWQGQPNRLHTRQKYIKNDKGSWTPTTLYP